MSDPKQPTTVETQPPVWETHRTFAEIIRKELDGLDVRSGVRRPGDPPSAPMGECVERELLHRNLFGLALSGGGIRSATFALGVIQRLAQLKLISRLDYLSTVSGGGYLGSWLAAWIRRDSDVREVEEKLIPPPEAESQGKEAEQITWLRKYGKYLAPETSLFSADTWLIVTLWVRNTTLNFAVLLLFLATALMFPWVVVEGYALSDATPGVKTPGVQYVLFGLHWVFLLWSTGLAIRGSRFRRDCKPIVGILSAFLLCLSSLMLTLTHWTTLANWDMTGFAWIWTPVGLFVAIYLAIPLVCMGSMVEDRGLGKGHLVFRMFVACVINLGIALGMLKLLTLGGDYWLRPIVLPGVISATLCLKLTVIIGMVGRHMPDERREWWSRVAAWMCIIGMIWFVLPSLALIGPVIFDFIRQSTLLAIASGGLWAAATGVGIFLGKSSSSSGTGKDAPSPIRETILPVLPLVFVFGMLILVSAALSHAVLNRAPFHTAEVEYCDQCKKETIDVSYAKLLSDGWQQFDKEVKASYAEARLHHPFRNPTPKDSWWEALKSQMGRLWYWMKQSRPPLLLLLSLIGYLILSRLIDINEFSMHRFYRNRLARGFQGAARDWGDKDNPSLRKADPFTNLDADDDIPMTHLRLEGLPEIRNEKKEVVQPAVQKYKGPIQLVNTAININLADTGLEERRASSFVFTPYGCGYSVGADEGGHYQPYPADCDLRLGTPVTASGAAASPNMGYHTSGPVAFLLTVFNVRLGYWMFNTKAAGWSLADRVLRKKDPLKDCKPDPSQDEKEAPEDPPRWLPHWVIRKLRSSAVWEPTGPKIGTAYFISELFGMASDDRKYVYLSDGGHFENMAVYELLRRRCRFIICVDGEQDEDMKFEGLAGLIRRARADLGCEIRIDTSDIEQRSKEEGWSKSHCAVGTIHYKENKTTRGVEETDGANTCYLLYIKLSVTGDEPTDIINYRKTNPAFPHQSTGDQFFNESQFESYRRLGWHAADRTMRSVDQFFPKTNAELAKKPPQLETVFAELRNAWYGVPRKISENFTKHTDTLTELLDELRKGGDLISLQWQLNGKVKNKEKIWGITETLPTPEQDPACFYFCQKLILFMETVFFDLDLESNYNHPACRGWMERFHDWSQSTTLKQTYAHTKHTYSIQFQSFFERLTQGILNRRK